MLDHHGWHPLSHRELVRHRARRVCECRLFRYDHRGVRCDRWVLRELAGRRLLCWLLAVQCNAVFSATFRVFGLVLNLPILKGLTRSNRGGAVAGYLHLSMLRALLLRAARCGVPLLAVQALPCHGFVLLCGLHCGSVAREPLVPVETSAVGRLARSFSGRLLPNAPGYHGGGSSCLFVVCLQFLNPGKGKRLPCFACSLQQCESFQWRASK